MVDVHDGHKHLIGTLEIPELIPDAVRPLLAMEEVVAKPQYDDPDRGENLRLVLRLPADDTLHQVRSVVRP
jgi:hypothetical protein